MLGGPKEDKLAWIHVTAVEIEEIIRLRMYQTCQVTGFLTD